jgi:hypothetical protein
LWIIIAPINVVRPAHLELRDLHGDALALGEAMVFAPVVPIARITLGIGDLEIASRLDAQPVTFDASLHDRGAADKDRLRQPLVHHDLHRAQHAFVLALGVDDAARRCLCRGEHRLHEEPRVVDELVQPVGVRGKVGDRRRGHTALHRRLGHRRRDLHDEPRIEGPGNEVFGPESHVLVAVGVRHDVRLLGERELGDRLHRGELHRLVDRGRTHVERAAENEREAEDVIDLVGVIRAPRRHHRVVADRLHVLGEDLRVGVGQREDEGPRRHLLHHVLLEDAAGRETQEHIRIGDDVGELARVGLACVAGLVVVHLRLAALVDHAGDVRDPDVLHADAEGDQHVEAGQRRGPRTRDHELHLRDVLFHHAKAVHDGGADDDRRPCWSSWKTGIFIRSRSWRSM